jgi:hypothetical protein
MIKILKTVTTVVLCAGLLFVVTFVLKNPYWIKDTIALRGYIASEKVRSSVETTQMTKSALRAFYAQKPELQSRTDFRLSCPETESTIVLGCYISNRGVFLQNVTDPRLDGIIEVTAAHEMLHVMFSRLSNEEKNSLGSQLESVLSSIENKRILELAARYKNGDRERFWSEMHSTIGTEVLKLPVALENHYGKYLTNRKQVVALSEKYEAVFTDLTNKATSLDADLVERSTEIDSLKQRLGDQSKQIDVLKLKLEELLKKRSVAEYNTTYTTYSNSVDAYNYIVGVLQNKVVEYNRIVVEYNHVAQEEKGLIEAIDTREQKQR